MRFCREMMTLAVLRGERSPTNEELVLEGGVDDGGERDENWLLAWEIPQDHGEDEEQSEELSEELSEEQSEERSEEQSEEQSEKATEHEVCFRSWLVVAWP